MEALVDKGFCDHIGVSNFSIAKLEALLKTATLMPEMNQIELHPYLQQPKMLEYCKSKNIHLTAFAPLGSADRPDRLKLDGEPILLEDPVIQQIADQHDATPAQILISWAVHRQTVVIPKSAKPQRIKQNLGAIDVSLSVSDMQEIAALDRHRRYISGRFLGNGWRPIYHRKSVG